MCTTLAALGVAFWPVAPSAEAPHFRSGANDVSSRSADPSKPAASLPSEIDLRGRHLFLRHCAICHGRWGDGRGEMALGMRPRPRNFTTGLFKFRSTPAGSLPTDDDLRRTIRNGIANSSMPTFGLLTEDEVTALVAYLKTLSPRWKDPAHLTPALPREVAPAWLGETAAAAPHVTEGGVSFVTYCAPCHGASGEGNGAAASSLEDFWHQPCPPADLTIPAYKSGSEPEDIYRTLNTGLDGSPMPEFRTSLSPAQRWNLVAYVLSLRSHSSRTEAAAGQ